MVQIKTNNRIVKYGYILFAILMISLSGKSQIVTFTDLELKAYLINEPCVDTLAAGHNNGIGQIDMDLNNDNEIQVSEMLQVKKIFISDASQNYSIKSIADLSQFKNLVFLSIAHIHDLVEISNLNLIGLKSLNISTCGSIKRIDVSDLVGLTESLRLDNLGNIDYLNIKNGSVAKVFSLFYTENTKYACVDSIAREYDMFYLQGGMIPGVAPSINCVTSVIDEQSGSLEVEIYPNPTKGIIKIKGSEHIELITIKNVQGQTIHLEQDSFEVLDLRTLIPGVYLIQIHTEFSIINRKIILN